MHLPVCSGVVHAKRPNMTFFSLGSGRGPHEMPKFAINTPLGLFLAASVWGGFSNIIALFSKA